MSFRLMVDLAGFGRHPAAWRRSPDPRGWFTGRHQRAVAQLAERGGFDAVTLHDTFAPAPAGPDEVRGGLEALTLAAALAPGTSRIGLVPTVTVTHTEPFHVAKNLATLDHVSRGRAGWVVAVSGAEHEQRLVNRRPLPDPGELHREAAAVVDTVGRLCDSWEDDAIIRDVATGRYLDLAKVHYVDVDTPTFSVRGPSITPRPPQGRPIVVVEVVDEWSAALAADAAEVACVDLARRWRLPAGPDGPLVVVDLPVLLGTDDSDAHQRLAALDELHGRPSIEPAYVGGPDGLVTLLAELAGEADGVRLQPSVTLDDLAVVVDHVTPALRRLGVRPPDYRGAILREHLGLARPANRYAADAADAVAP